MSIHNQGKTYRSTNGNMNYKSGATSNTPDSGGTDWGSIAVASGAGIGKGLAADPSDLTIGDKTFAAQTTISAASEAAGVSGGNPIVAAAYFAVKMALSFRGRSRAKRAAEEARQRAYERAVKKWKKQLEAYKGQVDAFSSRVGKSKKNVEKALYGGASINIAEKIRKNQMGYFASAGSASSGAVNVDRKRAAKQSIMSLDTLAENQETILRDRASRYSQIQRTAQAEISAGRKTFKIKTKHAADLKRQVKDYEGIYG